MSIGKEIAYRHSGRGKDSTGSLVFDVERKQAQREGQNKGDAGVSKATDKKAAARQAS